MPGRAALPTLVVQASAPGQSAVSQQGRAQARPCYCLRS